MNNQHEEFEPRQNIILCSKPSDRDLDPGPQREGLHSAGPMLKRNAYVEALVDRVWVSEIKGAYGRQQTEIENATVTRAMVVHKLMHECPSVSPEKQKRQS